MGKCAKCKTKPLFAAILRGGKSFGKIVWSNMPPGSLSGRSIRVGCCFYRLLRKGENDARKFVAMFLHSKMQLREYCKKKQAPASDAAIR